MGRHEGRDRAAPVRRGAIGLAVWTMVAVSLTGLAWPARAAAGVDCIWGGLATSHPGADGVLFANPANWFGYYVPQSTDRAIFSPVPAGALVVPAGTTNNQLLVNIPVVMNLSGGTYTVNGASPTVPVPPSTDTLRS